MLEPIETKGTIKIEKEIDALKANLDNLAAELLKASGGLDRKETALAKAYQQGGNPDELLAEIATLRTKRDGLKLAIDNETVELSKAQQRLITTRNEAAIVAAREIRGTIDEQLKQFHSALAACHSEAHKLLDLQSDAQNLLLQYPSASGEVDIYINSIREILRNVNRHISRLENIQPQVLTPTGLNMAVPAFSREHTGSVSVGGLGLGLR